jgi:hypothetical protein
LTASSGKLNFFMRIVRAHEKSRLSREKRPSLARYPYRLKVVFA